jgi:hypothetical protein
MQQRMIMNFLDSFFYYTRGLFLYAVHFLMEPMYEVSHRPALSEFEQWMLLPPCRHGPIQFMLSCLNVIPWERDGAASSVFVPYDALEDVSPYLDDLDSFDDLGLSDEVLRGVYAYGFESPSSLQRACFMPLLRGHNVVIQSPSGTGKTAMFLIALLHRLNYDQINLQAVVLVPSRELAMGTIHVLKGLGVRIPVRGPFTLLSHVVTGSRYVPVPNDVLVIVATPLRFSECLLRGHRTVTHVRILVLDEIEEMITWGFLPQLNEIIPLLPEQFQSMVMGCVTACSPLSDLTVIRQRDNFHVKPSKNKPSTPISPPRSLRMNLQV